MPKLSNEPFHVIVDYTTRYAQLAAEHKRFDFFHDRGKIVAKFASREDAHYFASFKSSPFLLFSVWEEGSYTDRDIANFLARGKSRPTAA